MEIWVVGKLIVGGWMAEGLYLSEIDAINAADSDEFIALVETGRPIPSEATDAKRLYWPGRETWEESKLYQMRLG